MKTPLELAHEWYMKHSESPSFMNTEVEMAWQYADAMQAEADKREKEKQEKLKQDQQNHHDELVSIGLEEWQPDWSQAPEWANWWAIGSLTKQGIWSEAKPNSVKINGADYWEVTSPIGDEHLSVAPSFNYQGDWSNSLRKRPQ